MFRKNFVIIRDGYYSSNYTLRIPILPFLSWPYRSISLIQIPYDDPHPHPSAHHVKYLAREELRTRWFVPATVADQAEFEIIY